MYLPIILIQCQPIFEAEHMFFHCNDCKMYQKYYSWQFEKKNFSYPVIYFTRSTNNIYTNERQIIWYLSKKVFKHLNPASNLWILKVIQKSIIHIWLSYCFRCVSKEQSSIALLFLNYKTIMNQPVQNTIPRTIHPRTIRVKSLI